MDINKDELFDVIIKGFGVAFLFLAIMAIPKVLEGLIMLSAMPFYPLDVKGDGDFKNIIATLRPGMVAQCIGSIVKFIIFIIASINFLRSGSWVKKLMGNTEGQKNDI